jgi:hypothetical protein
MDFCEGDFEREPSSDVSNDVSRETSNPTLSRRPLSDRAIVGPPFAPRLWREWVERVNMTEGPCA